MSLRIGVFISDFNPITSGQLDLCLDALHNTADRVLLVMLPVSDTCRLIASSVDRWRMLVASSSVSKSLIPIHGFDVGGDHASFDSIFGSLQKLYPKDMLIPIQDTSGYSDSLSNELHNVSENDFNVVVPSVLEYCFAAGLYGFGSSVKDAERRLDLLFKALNPHRFAHSLSVALTAKRLAVRFDIDKTKAEEAGLFHDCAKCISLSEMQHAARIHHLTDDPSVLKSGALLHSLVGASFAHDIYGIEDPEILEAIAYHNTGFPGMSRLAMCICLADFIEPNREPFPGLDETRHLAEYSLERALLLSLESTIQHVRSKGKKLHHRTIDTVKWLKSLPFI